MPQDQTGATRRQVLQGAVGLAAGLSFIGGGSAVAAERTGDGESGPQAGKLSAETAHAWMATAYQLVLLENLTPPAAARVYAYFSIAMYESALGGMPQHRSLAGQLTDLQPLPPALHRGHLDWPTALSAGADRVLAAVLPFVSATARQVLADAYAARLAERRTAGVSQRSVDASVAHGRAVGAALVDWIATDGAAEANRPYVPPTGQPHLWESTPPNFRPAIEPYCSELRTLVLRSSDEVAPAPHIPFSADPTSAFGQQAMATYNQSFVNTAEHKAIASFWTDNPGSFVPPLGTPTGLPSGHWMMICSQATRQLGLRLDDALEAYARVGVALHDAFVNCWTWKYRFQLLRPITYVRRYIDPTWSTFINTPQFPEYTSGHSVASPAAAVVLTDLLGTFAFTDNTHAGRQPARQFSSFGHAAAEAARSRLYGGIHYPMAIENGLAQGEEIAALVRARLRTRR
jgi:hypothetical protein